MPNDIKNNPGIINTGNIFAQDLPTVEEARLSHLGQIIDEIPAGVDSVEGSRSWFATRISSNVKAFLRTLGSPEDGDVYGRSATDSFSTVRLEQGHGQSWLHEAAAELVHFSAVADFSASIEGMLAVFIEDITGSLRSYSYSDITAAVNGVAGFDLIAQLESIPSVDLPAALTPIPGADLPTFAGGHFPVDIEAAINVVQPVDISGYVRSGESAQEDLQAGLTQRGYINDIDSFIRGYLRSSSSLSARIIVRTPVDLSARMHGYVVSDLQANIITQRIKDMRGILWGRVREAVVDFRSSLRSSAGGQKDLPVLPVKAVVSTHTSDKVRNIERVAKSFFENRYVFGTSSAGIFRLVLEPVYGDFPDLHGYIYAQQFFRENISAFIRPASPDARALASSLEAVTPFINLSKVMLKLQPLSELSSSFVPSGGYKNIRALARPVHKGITTTASDAGYTSTASSYKFVLGTANGIFIPPIKTPEMRLTTYRNDSLTPDLHASLSGWGSSDLGASIRDYPYSALGGFLNALSLDHLSNISARIAPHRVQDLAAALAVSGSLGDMRAEIEGSGAISDLTGSLLAYINPAIYSSLYVSTQPFSDMSAYINYSSIAHCARTSASTAIPAYVRAVVGGQDSNRSDLPGYLNALHLQLELPASVLAHKRTRVSILNLYFRANSRGTNAIPSSIVPVVQSFLGLAASVRGLSHEFDLSATLTPVRYVLPDVPFTLLERVVDTEGFSEEKEVYVRFHSQVGEYVYEQATGSIYSTDRGTWAIDVRTLLNSGTFFDLSASNRKVKLTALSEYYSIDEALRAAISLLCDYHQDDIYADVTASGSVASLSAAVDAVDSSRFSDIKSVVAAVLTPPDLSASVNTDSVKSSYAILKSIINPAINTRENLEASVNGYNVGDLSASVASS